MCASLTERGRFISLSRNWILGNIILIVCLLFFPVYKIKICNIVSVVVKTFLKNEANGCTVFSFLYDCLNKRHSRTS